MEHTDSGKQYLIIINNVIVVLCLLVKIYVLWYDYTYCWVAN